MLKPKSLTHLFIFCGATTIVKIIHKNGYTPITGSYPQLLLDVEVRTPTSTKTPAGNWQSTMETLRHGMHIETNKVPPIYLTMQRVDAQVM